MTARRAARGPNGADGGGDIFWPFFDIAGVGIFQTTPAGRFVRANPMMARLLGYDSPEQLVAETYDLARQFYADPAQREAALSVMERDGRVENMLIRIRRRDGSALWISATAAAERDAAGKTRSFIGTAVDVSELVRAQEAQARIAQDLGRIFDNAAEGIYRSTPDGRQLRANPALVRLNGYASEAEMLAAVNDIAAEWYVDSARRDEFKRLLERDGRVNGFVSEVYRHKTRERIWISENAWVVRDAAGRPLFYEGTVVDVTMSKRAESALRQAINEAEEANQAKVAFLANMSHELRTPLNAILGFAEVIRDRVYGEKDPRYIEYAKFICDSGGHLLTLINDILDMAKMDAGRLRLFDSDFDLGALVEHQTALLSHRAKDAGLTMTIDIAPGMPAVRADEVRLRQIVLNLVSNAVKFTQVGGTVTVRAWIEPDGRPTLAVADTGIGMTEDEIALALLPFRQVDAELARRYEGTGLGLPITKSLVALHDGEMQIDSEKGRGTTVTVRLPASRVVAAPAR